MKKVVINRFKITDNYTLGHCYITHPTGLIQYVGCSLERGWRNNENMISCVPEGTYPLVLEKSEKFKKYLWELKNVPNRAECKFHAANYWRQLNGCIALGTKHVDIDGDGDPDITASADTMRKFHEMMAGQSHSEVKINNITH